MELPVEFATLRDDTRITRTGDMLREKVAIFHLGKFGPFTERFAAESFSDIALQQRIDDLRRQIEQLHRS